MAKHFVVGWRVKIGELEFGARKGELRGGEKDFFFVV